MRRIAPMLVFIALGVTLIFPVELVRASGKQTNDNATHEAQAAVDEGTQLQKMGREAEAISLFYKAASLGSIEAKCLLGLAYYNGRGVKVDLMQAARWFQESALQGDNFSQFMLSSMYAIGEGVPKSDEQAFQWCAKAAKHGLMLAQDSLAHMYLDGKGVQQNYFKAAKLFMSVAERGMPSGQFNIGICYYNGFGVPRDYVAAYMWFALASVKGTEGASTMRDKAAAQLTPAQLSNAQKLASEWRPKM